MLHGTKPGFGTVQKYAENAGLCLYCKRYRSSKRMLPVKYHRCVTPLVWLEEKRTWFPGNFSSDNGFKGRVPCEKNFRVDHPGIVGGLGLYLALATGHTGRCTDHVLEKRLQSAALRTDRAFSRLAPEEGACDQRRQTCGRIAVGS